jgi:hypothetical protein
MNSHLIEGKKFEEAVKTALQLSGFNVTHELLLRYKKVDMYAEEVRLGVIQRIAVECKCHSKPLTLDEVTSIYSNYLPLYQQNIIDQVLIVTKSGITPSSESMVHSTRELNHITLADLQSMIMDFRTYIKGLIDNYIHQGFNDYYIPVKTKEGLDLANIIMDWIDAATPNPIAILGTYGIGKTTFAKHLGKILSEKHLENSTFRIPIVIKLSDISTEQSLEGLLGKLFTSISIVRNYTFDGFMELNDSGRLIIILDGFDEIKHTLSWDEFKYNFNQINRLVNPKSKVIIMGRPTAFLCIEEHDYALHGIVRYDQAEFYDPEWPNYLEYHIAPFNENQVNEFLEKYISWQYRNETDKKFRIIDKLKQRVLALIIDIRVGIDVGEMREILSRPVQLKMFIDVMPKWSGPLNSLTVTVLYQLFIDLIIKREQNKTARVAISANDRRDFAKEIAWWLWNNKKRISTTAKEIPESLLQKYCKQTVDIEALRRDLVSACFLERKLGDSLYFPHRSFQEFLVAEKMVEILDADSTLFHQIDSLITEEVSSFFSKLINIDHLSRWEVGLRRVEGTLSWMLLQNWIKEDKFVGYLKNKFDHTSNPWVPLILTAGICKHGTIGFSIPIYREKLIKKISTSLDADYAYLCFICAVAITKKTRLKMAYDLFEPLLIFFNDSSITKPSKKSRKHKDFMPITSYTGQQYITRKLYSLFASMKIIDKTNEVYLGETYSLISKALRNYCFLTE